MLYGYSTRRKGTTKIVERFCRGSNAVFNPIEDFEQNGIMPNATYVTTFGFLRGTANLFETAIRNGVNYLHIDHAYFLAGHRGWDSWYRVTRNDMNMNKITKRYPADRFMSKIYPKVCFVTFLLDFNSESFLKMFHFFNKNITKMCQKQ